MAGRNLRRGRELAQVIPRGGLLGGWVRRTVPIILRREEPGPIGLTPDGILAVATAPTGVVRVFDTSSGLAMCDLPGRFLALVPGSRALVADPDGGVALVELATGRVEVVLTGHTAPVEAAAVSAGAGVGLTRAADGARAWELATGRCLHAKPTPADSRLALTPDGGLALTGAAGEPLTVWKPNGGRVRGRIGGPGDLVALGPDGRVAVTAGNDGTVRLWDLTNGRERVTLSGEPGEVRHLSLIAHGSLALVGLDDGTGTWTVGVWDLQAGVRRHELSTHSGTNPIATPDDGAFAVMNWAGHQVWDLESGRPALALEGHYLGMDSVALSADGRVGLTADTRGHLCVWDLDWDLKIPEAGPALGPT